MLAEIAATDPPSEFRGFGINHSDAEYWNDFAIGETTLPWLQDPATGGVWDAWKAEWRDVVILDGQNRKLAVYPVYDKPLDDPVNYAELKALLLRAAGR